MATHETVPLHCTSAGERETWSATLEGEFEDITTAAASYNVGSTPTGTAAHAPICTDSQDLLLTTQCTVTRKEGLLGELTYAYSYIRKIEQWACDMAEISKDIKTWLVSPQVGMSEVDAAIEIAKIAQWEAFKDNGDFIKWKNFECDEQGNLLTGYTKRLAEKIMKGVQCYVIYAPVITKTSVWAGPAPLEGFGQVGAPSVRSGWTVIGGQPSWTTQANIWVKTGCRSNPNGDGTYTLVEQWTGMDQIDGDLYQSGGGSGGTAATATTSGGNS